MASLARNAMKRAEAFLIIGLVVGLSAGVGFTTLFKHRAPKDGNAQDATAELAVFNQDIKAGELQPAYDALLAAMRVAPGDEKVFDAALEFIRKAAKDSDDEGVSLAHDVYQRAANLVPFLSLARIKEARTSHTQVGDELFASKNATNPEDPFADAENLLAAVRRANLPASARSRLLHEVEAELGSQAKRCTSASMKPSEEEDFWKRWKNLKARYEEAQKEVLAALYQDELKPQLVGWAKKVSEFDGRGANASVEEVRHANDSISALIGEGDRISRELAGYLEAGVDAALKDNQDDGPDKHLGRLAHLREWNYNRWALDRVEKVEQSGGTALDKLTSMSKIDDARLAPYVGQRFADIWKRLFEECSKDDKVEATKLRILREFQP